MLREKIHHLDDMLKSQQRKVRQMIEQVRSGTGWRRQLTGFKNKEENSSAAWKQIIAGL